MAREDRPALADHQLRNHDSRRSQRINVYEIDRRYIELALLKWLALSMIPFAFTRRG